MATFRDDIETDLDDIFAEDESGFAREVTFVRMDAIPAVEQNVFAYSLELVYSVFDPKNQIKFFLRASDITGGYIPQVNDEVHDDVAEGKTDEEWVIMNVIVEENIYNITAQRMDLGQ